MPSQVPVGRVERSKFTAEEEVSRVQNVQGEPAAKVTPKARRKNEGIVYSSPKVENVLELTC